MKQQPLTNVLHALSPASMFFLIALFSVLVSSCDAAVARRLRARRGISLASNVSMLSDVRDKLEGILDAVESSFSTLETKLSAFSTDCTSKSMQVGQMKTQQANAITLLENDRMRNAQFIGALDAEVSHLTDTESSALSSYNAAVQRRVTERQVYLDWSATNQQQGDVLAQILVSLKEKQAALQESNASILSGSSIGGELDYIVGVFSHMQDEVASDAITETEKASANDKEIADLVASYSASLTHADTQYEVKAAEKTKYELDNLRIIEEKDLHNTFSDNWVKASEHFDEFCGEGKILSTAIDEGKKQDIAVKTQIDLALKSLTALGLLQRSVNHSQLRSQRVVRASHSQMVPKTVAVDVASLFDGGDPRPRKVPRKDPALTSSRKLAAVSISRKIRNASATELSAAAQQCASEKQSLMASIIATRQGIRSAQAQLQGTEIRGHTLEAWVNTTTAEKSTMNTIRSELAAAWTEAGSIIDGGAFASVIADAAIELNGIDGDVKTYAASQDAQPVAQALVVAVEAAATALSKLEALPLAALSTAYGNLAIALAASETVFSNKAEDLGIEKDAALGTLPAAQSAIEEQQASEASLEAQLQEVDASCAKDFFNATTSTLLVVKSHVDGAAVEAALRRGGLRGEVPAASEEAKAWADARRVLLGAQAF